MYPQLASLAHTIGGMVDVFPTRFARPHWNRGYGGCIPHPRGKMYINSIKGNFIVMSSELYTISNYTEEELYEILGFDSGEPSSEILETRIIDELRKYQNARTSSGRQMYEFLQELYRHFFHQDDDDSINSDHRNHNEKYDFNDPETINVLEETNYDDSYEYLQTSYNVTDYTTKTQSGDLQLTQDGIDLLGMSSSTPNQNELEAKLLQEMEKHELQNTEHSKKAFNLYKEIYQFFFFTEEPDEELDATVETQVNSNLDAEIISARTDDDDNLIENESMDKIGNTKNIQYNKDLDYTPGVVNPILKETFKRIISVDSQYRETVYPLATDFTLNFSETLKDVVSLKLYAVQIPITWYTISSSYGSNVIFLKPRDSPTNYAIYNNPKYEFKVEIAPGNYTPPTLANEVNTKIQELGNIYTDVSFGSSGFSYNATNTKGTFTFDIENAYQSSSYTMDISGDNIRDLLGFPSTGNISLNTVYSETFSASSIDNIETYQVDNSNNTITIRQYLSNDGSIDYNEANMTIIKDITLTIPTVNFTTNTNTYTIQEIFDILNNQISNNNDLVNSIITYEIVPESNPVEYYFAWTIEMNRNTKSNVPNSQVVIIFPTIGDDNINNSNQKTLWIKNQTDTNTSGFKMPNPILQLHHVMAPKTQLTTIQITGDGTETTILTQRTLSNESIIIRPKSTSDGIYINSNEPTIQTANDILLSIPDGDYRADTLITEIQRIITDTIPELTGSIITTTSTTIFKINVNKIYTTTDYRLVFYDVDSFQKCTSASKSYRNATADNTLGYILGYRDLSEYDLDPSNAVSSDDGNNYYQNPDTLQLTQSVYTHNNISKVVTLTGGSAVNIYLYNYFMIILDDFNQNHLNDGLVTIAPEDTSVTLPHYATRKNYRGCTDPEQSTATPNVTATQGLTQKQIYSVEQIIEAQNKESSRMSKGPYVKDMFALLPVKIAAAGNTYVEFGGTLQQQERIYFGPVNIRRIAIKLINDKGDVVDLNGNNWSFQLVCEQLYRGGGGT
mgnify:CR=1 FL=1